MNLIYLLGAGRSGTTLIATVLNSNASITTIGEMHQFYEYLEDDKKCSCEKPLNKCKFWCETYTCLDLKPVEISHNRKLVKIKEGHRNIPALLFKKKEDQEYLNTQTPIFECLKKNTETPWLLDSSKYVARYLLLKRSKKIKIKGIYVIRDVRGVINSFGKQVQTTKSPIATIIYYTLINLFAQLVCWLDKDVIKLKYEDFVDNPEKALDYILKNTINEEASVQLDNEFDMPHIIGGNRMKSNKQIIIKKDLNWKKTIPRNKQLLYYFLTFPLMILNKYKA
ncbi:hypothetical protein ES677_04775 [Bizionia gelidisalsuginis]|uniref:Sulfotransferase n=1 Tax=Bizionia gelidisalsuginis TaxID=291188 RepID=A0ABY3MCP3_9FLAO|nr:sulfotransferase [Bizionia gelidisalsuginis]TYC15659.1 hypothetical protein ES677_04775 [Bizionia gelidisalsuginis]